MLKTLQALGFVESPLFGLGALH